MYGHFIKIDCFGTYNVEWREKMRSLKLQYPGGCVFYDKLNIGQRVDTIKREMFSQKSVRRFVGDSSAFVMGAMFLASALNRGIYTPEILKNVY